MSNEMKLIMEGWRKYLNEAQKLEGKFALVLKIDPPTNIDKIISAGDQKYSSILPEGEQFTKLKNFHITLIPGQIYKKLSDDQKQHIIRELENNLAPDIDVSQVFLAARKDGRKTLYLKIQNSDELNQVIKGVFDGADSNRYMHLSVANVHAGDPFSSVGDINAGDEGEQKNIVPIIQQQEEKVKKQEPPTSVEIPDEIKPLGGILRAAMKDVAGIYPNLKRMKDNERALQGIINGVLRNKLGLSDEQIDAILGTL